MHFYLIRNVFYFKGFYTIDSAISIFSNAYGDFILSSSSSRILEQVKKFSFVATFDFLFNLLSSIPLNLGLKIGITCYL